MATLVFNAGSSSLKFGLFEGEPCAAVVRGIVDWAAAGRAELRLTLPSGVVREEVEADGYRGAVGHALRILIERGFLPGEPALGIQGVGHRVVHGGTLLRDSTQVDERVKAAILRLAELAPLHNPPALAAIEAAELALPDVSQVAVFDTAFFAGLPASAYVYPLPYEWHAEWGVRRFGFHGVSHAYSASRAAELLGRDPARLRLVICHLGNGCSASAVRAGAAIATTMGYTPLDGLMMGTRAGSLDPGILLYLARERGVTFEQLSRALHHGSGLLGVSGVSSDYRAVEATANAGGERAQLALTMYADRVRSAVGALTVSMGGIDALVFTAGVGENSASLRQTVCNGLECLGLHLDQHLNRSITTDGDIATTASPGRILVIQTREDLAIAREVRRVLGV